MKTTILALAVMLLVGCRSSNSAESVPLADISTILSSPSVYDGVLVRVQGPAIVRFEASFVCPTIETLDAPDGSRNCLWLVPGETGEKTAYDLRPLDGKVVEIVGRFDAKHSGHMGAYGGTVAVTWSKIAGSHSMRGAPPPPPPAARFVAYKLIQARGERMSASDR